MSTPTMITVQGTFLKSDGTPEKGSLEFYNSNYVMQSGGITTVVPSLIRATLDDQGFISVTIPATDDPDWRPSGWTYTLVFKLSGDYSTINVAIPYDSPGGIIPVTKLVPAINVPVVSGPHTHDASDIVSGTFSIARLPVGTSHTQVAFGDHTHDDRYFTEAVVTSALADKANTSALAPVALSGSYNDLTDKPSAGTGGVTSVAGKTGDVTLNKTDVGLSNVDNTSDTNKPVSTATATALSGKANTAHTHAQSDVTGLTTALAGKANTSSLATVATSGSYTDLINKPTIPTVPVTSVSGKTGDVTLTKSDVGLANVDNTSDANKPISTATQTALTGLDSRVTTLENAPPSSGGGGASIGIASGYVTSGDITPGANATMTIVPGLTFSIPAVVDDNVEFTLTGLLKQTLDDFFELVVISAGSIVRYSSTGTSSPTTAGEGDPAIYPNSGGSIKSITTPFTVTVTSGDLDSGDITFGVAFKGSANGKVYASASYPLRWNIKNFKH